MRLPSKIFSFNESVLSKFPLVLTALSVAPLSIRELYQQMVNKVEDVSEFLEVLDCLYALGKIRYDEEMRALCYVG